ncbi:MAG: hypothetical protein MJE77_46175 [Proteobacteria bacterium]|nr:hypothetical protein [Pseudomonadota bacterium]
MRAVWRRRWSVGDSLVMASLVIIVIIVPPLIFWPGLAKAELERCDARVRGGQIEVLLPEERQCSVYVALHPDVASVFVFHTELKRVRISKGKGDSTGFITGVVDNDIKIHVVETIAQGAQASLLVELEPAPVVIRLRVARHASEAIGLAIFKSAGEKVGVQASGQESERVRCGPLVGSACGRTRNVISRLIGDAWEVVNGLWDSPARDSEAADPVPSGSSVRQASVQLEAVSGLVELGDLELAEVTRRTHLAGATLRFGYLASEHLVAESAWTFAHTGTSEGVLRRDSTTGEVNEVRRFTRLGRIELGIRVRHFRIALGRGVHLVPSLRLGIGVQGRSIRRLVYLLDDGAVDAEHTGWKWDLTATAGLGSEIRLASNWGLGIEIAGMQAKSLGRDSRFRSLEGTIHVSYSR